MSTRKHHTKLMAIVVAACLAVMCLALAACGGSSSSSAASSASASSASASASASSSAASSSSSASTDISQAVVGTWQIAAAEAKGVLMGGDIGKMLSDNGMGEVTFNADGTGQFGLGDEPVAFKWEKASDDAITMSAADGSTFGKEEVTSIPVTLKDDGALWMEYDINGEAGNVILTEDGTYAAAPPITLDGTKPITNAADLQGKWQIVGINMGGIAMYGASGDLASATGATDLEIDFQEGGTAVMSNQTGSWEVTSDGATMTSSSFGSDVTTPVVAKDDGVIIDFSSAMGGVTWIYVLEKA